MNRIRAHKNKIPLKILKLRCLTAPLLIKIGSVRRNQLFLFQMNFIIEEQKNNFYILGTLYSLMRYPQ